MAAHLKLDDRADLQISILIAVGWFALTLQVFWNSWPPDLSAAYFAGHFYAIENFDGVYAAPTGFFGPDFPQLWKDYRITLGYADAAVYPFVYPPIWAALFAPLTKVMGPFTFFNIFLVMQLAMTAASVFLVYRMAKPKVPMVIWSALSFAVVWFSIISTSAFVHNQLQITVTFLTILSFERFIAGKSVQAGVFLAVAAAIKLSPAALFLIFLVEKDKRAMVSFVVVGGALGLASLAVAGIDLHLQFLERLREISSVVALMKVNYNLEAFLVETSAVLQGVRLDPSAFIKDQTVLEPIWVTITVRTVLVASVVLVFLRSRHLDRRPRLIVRQCGLLLAITLCAPLAWTHHFLASLLLMPCLFLFYRAPRATLIMLGVTVITNVRMFVVWTDMSTIMHLHMFTGVITFATLWAAIVFAPMTWQSRLNTGAQPA